MVESESDLRRALGELHGLVALVRDRRRTVEDLHDARRGSGSAREGDDEVRDVDDREERLRHVVHEGDDLALGEFADVHATAAHPENGDDAEVHDEEDGRVENGRELAHRDGRRGLVLCRLAEALGLMAASPEGADDADARQRLARDERDLVELRLHGLEVGHRSGHHVPEDEADDRGAHEEHESELEVDEQGGDHGAHSEDGPPDELTNAERDGDLHLVDVVGDSRHERGDAEVVDVGARELVDLLEEGISYVRARPLGDEGGHLLTDEREAVANDGEDHEKYAETRDDPHVVTAHSDVDHTSDDDGRQEVEDDLDDFAQDADDHPPAVLREDEPLEQLPHARSSPSTARASRRARAIRPRGRRAGRSYRRVRPEAP